MSRRRSPLTPAATRGVGRGRRRAGGLAVSRRRSPLRSPRKPGTRRRCGSPGRAGGVAAASGSEDRGAGLLESPGRGPWSGGDRRSLPGASTSRRARRIPAEISPRRPGARRRCGSCIRSETAALVSSNLRGAARVPAQIAAHSRLHPRSRPWASTSRTARHVRRRSPLRSPRRLGAQTMARAEIAAVVAWKGPGRSPWRRERPVNRRTFPLSEFRSELLAGLFLKRRT